MEKQKNNFDSALSVQLLSAFLVKKMKNKIRSPTSNRKQK